ncbi:MFS transporter [Nocardia sp.]|uniref:MFS transporter n=1 Tax=Nocardia sp. TaxID=1821 RepID=UPI00263945BB|nr:MFS transporter [Nocardia sp.]
MATTTAPLGQDFRRMWVAGTTSSFGTAVSTLALPLVAVSTLHASTFQVGLLDAAGTVAWLAIGLQAGVWVEGLRRRPLLIGCDLIRAVLLLSIPLAAVGGVLSLAQLIVVALGMGMIAVVYGVARQTYLPFLVSREQLVAANGRSDSAQTAASAGGQLLGGVLVTAIGAATAVLIDVGSYLVSAWLMARIGVREPAPEQAGKRGVTWDRLTAGLRYVLRDPVIRPLTFTVAAVNAAGAALSALLVPYLVHDVGASATVIGLIMALSYVGGFLGATVSGRLVRVAGPVTTLFAVVIITPLFELLVPVTTGPLATALVSLGLTVGCAGGSVLSIVTRSHRQASVPREFLARVSGSIRFITWGVLPIGALAGGALGTVLGNRPALWVVCGVALAGGLPLGLALAARGRGFLAELRGPSEEAR